MTKAIHILTALLLMFPGCRSSDQDSEAQTYTGPVNICTSDSTCSPNTCHPELGICVSEPTIADVLYAKLIPKISSDIPVQIFPVPRQRTEDLLLPLQIPVSVKNISPSVNATVVFTDLDNSLTNRESNIAVYKSVLGMSNKFKLLPSTYRVAILPSDQDLTKHPARYIDNVIVNSAGEFTDTDGTVISIDITDDENSYKLFTGTILYQQTIDQSFPANGLQVVAKDIATHRFLSTIEETRCIASSNCGYFALKLAPDADEFILEISKPTEPFHPTYTHYIEDEDDVEDLVISLPIPQIPNVLHGKVAVVDGNTLPKPAPKCQLLFEMGDNITDRFLKHWVTTNESGQIEGVDGFMGVYLYPDTYNITVFPMAESTFDPTEYRAVVDRNGVELDDFTNLDTDSESAEWTLTLETRLTVHGNTQQNGQQIPSVPIHGTPILGQDTTVLPSNTSSNNEGTYAMYIDDGTYYIIGEAPPESLFAWGQSIWSYEEGQQPVHDIQLTIPFVIMGQLIPPADDRFTHLDVEGAIIEWYREYNGQTFLIGRTTVEKEGYFTALLPPA